MRSSSTAKPAQKKLTTSQRSPDRFSTIGLTRGAAEAPPHAGSRPTRPSVRRRDIPGAFVRYRSASDRRHVEGHAGEYPPMPATEVDPDFSPTNGSPSSTVNASCDWREPRVFEDRSGGTRAGARSFTQSTERPRRFCRHLRIVVASPPRFRRATRTGDRKSANPPFGDSLFSAGGAHPRPPPDEPPSASDRHVPAPRHQQIKGAPPPADDEPEMTEEERQLADGVAKLAELTAKYEQSPYLLDPPW